jgi:hypothetical protein
MTRVTKVGILCAVVVYGECIQVEPRPTGTIEVAVHDLTGASFAPKEVEVLELYSRKLIYKGERTRLEGLPWGAYDIRVFSPGFLVGVRRVILDQAVVSARVQLQIGQECGPSYSTLTGTISGKRPSKGMWAKVTSVVGVQSNEATIGANGRFTIGGLAPGKYILNVMYGDSLLHSRVLDLLADAKLGIDLE